MDELFGIVIGAVIVVVIVGWIVGLILTALAWMFIAASDVLGHPTVTLAVLCAGGAAVGVIRHVRRHGPRVAPSSDDFAQLWSLVLTPEQWALLVLGGFVVIVGLFGVLLA